MDRAVRHLLHSLRYHHPRRRPHRPDRWRALHLHNLSPGTAHPPRHRTNGGQLTTRQTCRHKDPEAEATDNRTYRGGPGIAIGYAATILAAVLLFIGQ
jgi:hypothetical protein